MKTKEVFAATVIGRRPSDTLVLGVWQQYALNDGMWNAAEFYDPTWGLRLNLSAGLIPGTRRIQVVSTLVDPGSMGLADFNNIEEMRTPIVLGRCTLQLQPR